MKVKELIAELQKVDQESLVIMMSDPEGNDVYTLEWVNIDNNQAYDKEGEDVGPMRLTKKLREEGYEKEDLVTGEKCVVLWP